MKPITVEDVLLWRRPGTESTLKRVRSSLRRLAKALTPGEVFPLDHTTAKEALFAAGAATTSAQTIAYDATALLRGYRIAHALDADAPILVVHIEGNRAGRPRRTIGGTPIQVEVKDPSTLELATALFQLAVKYPKHKKQLLRWAETLIS